MPIYVGNMKRANIDRLKIILEPLMTNSGAEGAAQLNQFTIGEKIQNEGAYNDGFTVLHKSNVRKVRMYGEKAFVGTYYAEDEYEIMITDLYYLSDKLNGMYGYQRATFTGSKSEVSFEDIEERRLYFRRLIEKLVDNSLGFY